MTSGFLKFDILHCLLNREYQEVIREFSQPKAGSVPMTFPSKFAQPVYSQFRIILSKYISSYWRMSEYNSTRYLISILIALLFGALYWQLGGQM